MMYRTYLNMQIILSHSSLNNGIAFFLDGHIEVHQIKKKNFICLTCCCCCWKKPNAATCPAFLYRYLVFMFVGFSSTSLFDIYGSSSSTLSILRALRDRASISPISIPLLNSAGMDFIPSIHSLPTPLLEVVVVVVVIVPATDPAERANRSSLDGPTTSRPASRTVPTSAGPSPNRECSFVVVFVAALLL